jgi:hypothetical protein
MKKMIALAISLSLLAPVANAGILKKLIIGGAIVYGANALANNYKQKQQQPQPYQQPNQYGQYQQQYPQQQYQQNPQYQNYQQYQPNQVNRPYSPNY